MLCPFCSKNFVYPGPFLIEGDRFEWLCPNHHQLRIYFKPDVKTNTVILTRQNNKEFYCYLKDNNISIGYFGNAPNLYSGYPKENLLETISPPNFQPEDFPRYLKKLLKMKAFL